MDAPLSPASPLRIAARQVDWLPGDALEPGRNGTFVLLMGADVDARAEINDDGEVAELAGDYPAQRRSALIDLAWEVVNFHADEPETVWTVDAAGGFEQVEIAIAEAA